MKKGFTLVEMLVVISILSIFGILILTIFTRTLRGGNKAQIIGVIKQNGQSVLENMDKTIRNADSVACPRLTDSCMNASPPSCKTLIVRDSSGYTRYRFVDPSPTVFPTVNGLIKKDNPAPISNTDAAFIDSVCPDISAMSTNAITITDTNTQTGVSIENGSFTIYPSPGSKNQVTIKFNVKPGISAPTAVAGQIDAVTFQTTVQLR